MSLAHDYAEAIVHAAHAEKPNAKELVANLKKHLEEQGRLKLLPHILRELRRIEAQEAKLAPMVEVAHQKDGLHALKKAAEEHGIHAAKVHVNHTLVQGWRASGNGKLVDASAKRQLIDLYKKVLTF
jgi:F0F1-type ATP synthase delta subunit